MKLSIGQIVEWQLRDGRKIKAVVKNFDNFGVVLEDAVFQHPDGTISTASVTSVAIVDIIEKFEEKVEEKIEEKVVEKIEEKVEQKVEEKSEEKVTEQIEEKVEEKVVEKVEEKVVEKIEEKVEETRRGRGRRRR